MGSCDYQQVTSIKCPIRIVGPDAECPIRIVFCPISIVPLPNFTRIFAATQQRVAKPETSQGTGQHISSISKSKAV